jgi:hypothetical protein
MGSQVLQEKERNRGNIGLFGNLWRGTSAEASACSLLTAWDSYILREWLNATLGWGKFLQLAVARIPLLPLSHIPAK